MNRVLSLLSFRARCRGAAGCRNRTPRRHRPIRRRWSASSRSRPSRSRSPASGSPRSTARQRADSAAGLRLPDAAHYREGAFVRKGEVLFEIDPGRSRPRSRRRRAQLAESQAQLAKAERDLARDRPLAEQRAIAQSQLDNDMSAHDAAQAAVASAKAAVEAAQLNLGFTRVTSLIDGVAAIATRADRRPRRPGDAADDGLAGRSDQGLLPVSEQEYLRHRRARSTRRRRRQARGSRAAALTLVLADGSIYPAARRRCSRSIARSIRRPARSGSARSSRTRATSSAQASTAGSGRRPRSARTRCSCRSAPWPSCRAATSCASSTPDNRVSVRTVTLGDRVGNRWIVEKGLQPGDRVVVEAPSLEGRRDRQRRSPAAAAGERTDMSRFFIRRPIVAIVIAIVTVLGGMVAMRRPADRAVPADRAAADHRHRRNTRAPTP